MELDNNSNNTYFYPDTDDALTFELIESVSSGNYWEESENQAFRSIEPIVAELADNFGINGLDIGCGKGRLLPYLAERCDRVYALEPDTDRFHDAETLVEESGLSSRSGQDIVIWNGDISTYKENAGDTAIHLALNSHVLQHINQTIAEDMYMRLSEIMTRGGILVLLTTLSSGAEDKYSKEYFRDGKRFSESCSKKEFEAAAGIDGVLPVAFYTIESVERILGACGFTLEYKWGFHFSDDVSKLDVNYDIEHNQAGDLSNARDIMYIFRRQ